MNHKNEYLQSVQMLLPGFLSGSTFVGKNSTENELQQVYDTFRDIDWTKQRFDIYEKKGYPLAYRDIHNKYVFFAKGEYYCIFLEHFFHQGNQRFPFSFEKKDRIKPPLCIVLNIQSISNHLLQTWYDARWCFNKYEQLRGHGIVETIKKVQRFIESRQKGEWERRIFFSIFYLGSAQVLNQYDLRRHIFEFIENV